ncbi:MAG: HAMP domain-containing sensor histidine kinase, partial [Chloroflexota bacterium]
GNERVAVRAMQVGASDYVVKDVSMGYIELLPRVMHQVLDQRRLEIEHERARQLLETEKLKTELIRDFIEKASHEFRTPISVIQTACYMIGRIDDPQKRQYYLNRIQDKSEGITKLVDNLVLLMKLDARYDLTLQSIYLRDIIDATVETLSQSYQDKYINIVVDNQTPKTKVVGDIDLLRRAIREVLDNACRYSYDESTVNMTVTGDAHTVSIVVEDNGIGIAEENLPKIFDRFYRVDEAHSTQGFGLGLSIASRIVDLTHGDITVQSEFGMGTTVTLELPSNIMPLA